MSAPLPADEEDNKKTMGLNKYVSDYSKCTR